jgi:hypothetical protein
MFFMGAQSMYWNNTFFPKVAIPMAMTWKAHKETKMGMKYVTQIAAVDWAIACQEWLVRRVK